MAISNWWGFIPCFFFFIVTPATVFYFFCLYASFPCKWHLGALYTLLVSLWFLAETSLCVTGFLCLLPRILLLFLCGFVLQHKNKTQLLAVASLVISVSSICHGLSYLFFFWLMTNLAPEINIFVLCIDSIQALAEELLTILSLWLIWKYFRQGITRKSHLPFLSLAIPIFYIALVERMIQDSIYGNTIVWDSDFGIVSPTVNHTEILILHFFACACLFLTLVAWQKIQKAFHDEQTIQLLKQQTQAQEIYMEEIRLRYKQTQAFRHDIQNHLSVVETLLSIRQISQAQKYLARLGQISSQLSPSVQTGNAAVDALLGTKFSLAKQREISVSCQLRIPSHAQILDIDWCILLANAVDNALKSATQLPPTQRDLLIFGRQKGNFYLLSIENSCSPSISIPPREGIGLSNIRAVAEKYQGTVKIVAGDGRFKLQLFFLLSETPDIHNQ
ncbi:MAG: GHKL domain-containing protein [Lachnospiraceae bacterium]|jgi:hypothetical protein|nr:GHKL domain-containing protein [Lachnospiraceae bacterium]